MTYKMAMVMYKLKLYHDAYEWEDLCDSLYTKGANVCEAFLIALDNLKITADNTSSHYYVDEADVHELHEQRHSYFYD